MDRTIWTFCLALLGLLCHLYAQNGLDAPSNMEYIWIVLEKHVENMDNSAYIDSFGGKLLPYLLQLDVT